MAAETGRRGLMTVLPVAEHPVVGVVHDYFTQRGGAERVAERLANLFPGSTLYTSVTDPDALPESIDPRRIQTTRLQTLRSAGMPLKAMAPILPRAFSSIDLRSHEVVISSSSAFAHHVRPLPGSVHICYCHTPPAFLWKPATYFGEHSATRRLAAPALAVMRRWDLEASRRVDVYAANSRFTAARIRSCYGRTAQVIYPPIETRTFLPTRERSGRFLIVARLRRHKSLQLAISAANRFQLPLDVVGAGTEQRRLEEAAGPTVRFLGRRDDAEVAHAMARCVALVVPGIEDFGMATAEVQAAGRPPITLAEGGALEIIRDGETGFLVAEQSADAYGAAMLRALREELDPNALVDSARRFDVTVFEAAIGDLVERARARFDTSRAQSGEILARSRSGE